MAVLIEAISVVVKRSSVDEKFNGGWQAFADDVPNDTLCADDEIVRVGFMSPADVESYVQHLESLGLTYVRDNMAQDMVVVDQQRGLAISCDWAETGRISFGWIIGQDNHGMSSERQYTRYHDLSRWLAIRRIIEPDFCFRPI